jgi:hypothetical protein
VISRMAACGPPMNEFMVARTVLLPLRMSFWIAPNIAGIGALIIVSTGLACATEYNVASLPKLDVAFNAKWDRCESLARQRGVPPGKTGYGAFVENCMEKVSPNPSRVTARAAESLALEHPGARRR